MSGAFFMRLWYVPSVRASLTSTVEGEEVLHNSFQSLNEYNAIASNHLHGKRSIKLSICMSVLIENKPLGSTVHSHFKLALRVAQVQQKFW